MKKTVSKITLVNILELIVFLAPFLILMFSTSLFTYFLLIPLLFLMNFLSLKDSNAFRITSSENVKYDEKGKAKLNFSKNLLPVFNSLFKLAITYFLILVIAQIKFDTNPALIHTQFDNAVVGLWSLNITALTSILLFSTMIFLSSLAISLIFMESYNLVNKSGIISQQSAFNDVTKALNKFKTSLMLMLKRIVKEISYKINNDISFNVRKRDELQVQRMANVPPCFY